MLPPATNSAAFASSASLCFHAELPAKQASFRPLPPGPQVQLQHLHNLYCCRPDWNIKPECWPRVEQRWTFPDRSHVVTLVCTGVSSPAHNRHTHDHPSDFFPRGMWWILLCSRQLFSVARGPRAWQCPDGCGNGGQGPGAGEGWEWDLASFESFEDVGVQNWGSRLGHNTKLNLGNSENQPFFVGEECSAAHRLQSLSISWRWVTWWIPGAAFAAHTFGCFLSCFFSLSIF